MVSKDVFICHASEDKERYVRPLTDLLDQNGISYWLDQEELRLGDHLEQRIKEALNSTRFALVVFSEAFMSKDWANRELELIQQREKNEGRVILLPLLEDIAESSVVKKYGFLRDRRFLRWSEQRRLVADLKHYLDGSCTPERGMHYGYFLDQIEVLNRVLHWVPRVVPVEDTQSFLEALQVFFHGQSPFLDSVSGSLTSAIDNLCRVLACDPEISKHYGQGKLRASFKYLSAFLVDGFSGSDMHVNEAIYSCEKALDEKKMADENRASLVVYLLLLRYLDRFNVKKGYHPLNVEIGMQLYELLSRTVPAIMPVSLPLRHDEWEWNDIYLQTGRCWSEDSSE